jgi:hypothetical protein
MRPEGAGGRLEGVAVLDVTEDVTEVMKLADDRDDFVVKAMLDANDEHDPNLAIQPDPQYVESLPLFKISN